MPSGPRLTFLRDPAEFLIVAGDLLAAEPVLTTVVSSIAHRTLAQLADGFDQPAHDWWLVVEDAHGVVISAGMRTAPFPPRPLFLLPMPEEAALGLARALHGRGEYVGGLNGALPAARICAEELARLQGGGVEVAQHTRLHELVDLVEPAPVPGRLASGTEADLDLVTAWFSAFMGDADEQAGRPRGASAHESPDPAELMRRLHAGTIWFWLDGSGAPVHMTGANPPSFGVARVGPVYTPPEQRGRGWASAAVAAVSRLLLAQGARVCLFTDQANPTSNKIYAALGYRPVVDMANLSITD